MDETMLMAFMYVLIAFIVVLVILGVVLIVFLRVILSALSQLSSDAPTEETQQTEAQEDATDEISATVLSEDDADASAVIVENNERVRYERNCAAKLCRLNDESKAWYSELKNVLLSYRDVKARMSWRCETFRIGKTTAARFTVRGKTLCLLLAASPASYTNTKYTVEDVSGNVTTADTPTLYRIKSAKRVKYAKEMINDLMGGSNAEINPTYVAQDYFMPYEGDVTLIQRGLVKRIVKSSARKYRIEEINDEENDGSEDAAEPHR